MATIASRIVSVAFKPGASDLLMRISRAIRKAGNAALIATMYEAGLHHHEDHSGKTEKKETGCLRARCGQDPGIVKKGE